MLSPLGLVLSLVRCGGEESRIDTAGVKRVTCESCCESEDRPSPAKHHGLWQLFPLLGGVSCGLEEDERYDIVFICNIYN